ncbi:MAG: hypothetical protein JXQ75_09045 [Phycisphaerae bacterium]|nr:hypothetical protein [Phycisphaerae bacterium]
MPTLTEETRHFASYIAMVVRNAMEDFHCEHLTDDQMRELNPIVRNAICTALHAFHNYEQDKEARKFVDFQFRMIPHYWKAPELLPDYVRLWEREG